MQGYDVITWNGLLAPKGTPAGVVRQLNHGGQRGTASASTAKFTAIGLLSEDRCRRQQFGAMVQAQVAHVGGGDRAGEPACRLNRAPAGAGDRRDLIAAHLARTSLRRSAAGNGRGGQGVDPRHARLHAGRAARAGRCRRDQRPGGEWGGRPCSTVVLGGGAESAAGPGGAGERCDGASVRLRRHARPGHLPSDLRQPAAGLAMAEATGAHPAAT